MITLHSGKEFAERMGMRPATLAEHVRRGTVTTPLGRVGRPGDREEFFWTESDAPALNLLGAAAIVPAADWLGEQEMRFGYYITPSRSSSHLGRYDNVSALGLCTKRRVKFYRVIRIIRIGYLDPVRQAFSSLEGQRDLPLQEGDEMLTKSQLSPDEASAFRKACIRRAELSLEKAEGFISNPGELTLYALDTARPLAVDVYSESIIRGVSFTADKIVPGMESVSTATLNEIAQSFPPSA